MLVLFKRNRTRFFLVNDSITKKNSFGGRISTSFPPIVCEKAFFSTTTTTKTLAGHSIIEKEGLDFSGLHKLLQKTGGEFDSSNVYDKSKKEKTLDDSLRKSQYRRLRTSSEIFDEIENNILRKFDDEHNQFILVRNDVTEIIYGKGDFFKEHADFLSMKTNVFEEFTLILSLTKSLEDICVGGETKLTFTSGQQQDRSLTPTNSYISKATTGVGSGLMFRKDIVHEGVEVQEGTKHILTLNCWRVRLNDTNQLLAVTITCSSNILYFDRRSTKNVINDFKLFISTN